MKALFAVAPAIVLLSACTAGQMFYTYGETNAYTCTDGASVNAQYSKSGSVAKVSVSVPSANLDNESITLNQTTAASGVRYLNDSNPANTYEWHTNGQEGIFSILWENGEQYQTACTL